MEEPSKHDATAPRDRHESTVRGDRRREQILETAVEMFGEVGYRGASLRDIAQRVGITHPGLLYHFHSKEELLLEVLSRRDAHDMHRFDVPVEDSPEARLAGVVELVRLNASRKGLIELFTTLSAEAIDPGHPAHTYFSLRYQMVLDLHERMFVQCREAGLLREGVDPVVAARSLVALMDGLQVQWLHDQGQVDMPAVVANFLDQQLTRPLAELVDQQPPVSDPAA